MTNDRLYSCSALMAVVFTLLFVPETKDKRLDQISEGFANKGKNKKLEVGGEGEEKENETLVA